ncbi:unnamed protein product, partial [Cladocopium goreaui]
MAMLTFSLECRGTLPGQAVFIVGSVAELGTWKIPLGLQCTTTPQTFPIWTGEVAIKEFKMVTADEKDAANPVWEVGGSALPSGRMPGRWVGGKGRLGVGSRDESGAGRLLKQNKLHQCTWCAQRCQRYQAPYAKAPAELENICEMPDREDRISHKDFLRPYHPDKNLQHVQVNGLRELHGWAAEKPSHKDFLRPYHPDKNLQHVQVNGLRELHGWAAEKPRAGRDRGDAGPRKQNKVLMRSNPERPLDFYSR